MRVASLANRKRENWLSKTLISLSDIFLISLESAMNLPLVDHFFLLLRYYYYFSVIDVFAFSVTSGFIVGESG